MAKVTMKVGGKIANFKKAIKDPQVKHEILERWTKLYAAYIRKRFVAASRGDGTWKPLAASTIKRRKKKSKAILRDTGLLFSHLAPEVATLGPVTVSGHVSKATVRFGGEGNYPSGESVTDVMGYHQKGGGNLPKREILVDPTPEIRKQMADAAKAIMLQHMKNG